MIVRIVAAAGAGLVVALLAGSPASAHTQEKYATCGWHADELNITGQKRRNFMKRCTANEDSPRGKPVGTSAKPAAKPKAQ